MRRLRLYLDLCTSSYLAIDDGHGHLLASAVHKPSLRNEDVLDAIEGLLKGLGRSWSDLGAIAVASGPGSFTGIRVGVALAQGLAFAHSLPLHAFSTLAALHTAFATHSESVVAAISAHGGKWYFQETAQSPDQMVTKDTLITFATPPKNPLSEAVVPGARIALVVTGELPEGGDLLSSFEKVMHLEASLSETMWSALFGFAFAQPQARLGIIRPHYVQASAAEVMRLATPMETRFRPSRLSDLKRLVDLELECNSQPWSDTSLIRLMQDSRYMGGIAEIGTRDWDKTEVIGYWMAQTVGDEAELLLLGISKPWRRRGVARNLMASACLTLAEKEVHHLHLEVRATNEPALALYRAVGFAPSGLRKGYYSDTGEDAVLMTRFVKFPSL
jgi:[ribosomal protein S18]-alanine N-acetyltransferase